MVNPSSASRGSVCSVARLRFAKAECSMSDLMRLRYYSQALQLSLSRTACVMKSKGNVTLGDPNDYG